MADHRILRVDPYDPGPAGMIVHAVTQRMLAFGRRHIGEIDPDALVGRYLTALWSKSPYVLILAAVTFPEGHLVGHAVATLEEPRDPVTGRPMGRWVFVQQCQMDPHGPKDGVGQMIEQGDAWAREHSVTLMLMATARSDKAWARKYAFRTDRTIMSRQVGAKHEEPAA